MHDSEEDGLPKDKKWSEQSTAEKILCISGVAIFVMGILTIGIMIKMEETEIENNKGFTTGQIIDCEHIGGISTRYNLKYTYTVDGVIYEKTGYSTYREKCAYFRGKHFPVIYSTKNPEKAGILIDRYAFEAWGLTFPDSLHWVEDIKEGLRLYSTPSK